MKKKHPTSNTQHPEKIQTMKKDPRSREDPKSKIQCSRFIARFGASCLVLLWILDLGPWIFSGCWMLDVDALAGSSLDASQLTFEFN